MIEMIKNKYGNFFKPYVYYHYYFLAVSLLILLLVAEDGISLYCRILYFVFLKKKKNAKQNVLASSRLLGFHPLIKTTIPLYFWDLLLLLT